MPDQTGPDKSLLHKYQGMQGGSLPSSHEKCHVASWFFNVCHCLGSGWIHRYYSFPYSQYQYPEFGPKPGEIKKKPAKQYTSIQWVGGSNSEMHHFLCQTEFHPVLKKSFLFPERLHCCYICYHCSYLYNYYSYLEPCEVRINTYH